MSKSFTCPSCGATVEFVASTSVFAVCSYCRSTLVRKDLGVESIGKMAELKEDASPFQIGTTGTYDRVGFVLLGRVRLNWDEGFWNEWSARFDDGREGWLAEAQGFFMMSFEAPGTVPVPEASAIREGQKIKIGPMEYEVEDIKDVVYAYAEGELPFAAPQGLRARSVDLVHGEDYFASISYEASGEPTVFLGRYKDFEEFKFKNLRVIDGW